MTENGALHLSDEWLSSHLDHEPPPSGPGREETGGAEDERVLHLDSCEMCRDRLEALGAAKLLVATPVDAPSEALRSRAITSAMTAFHDGADGTVRAERAEPWYRSRRVLIGAAAAAVVALAVSLPLTLTRNGASTSSAARSTHASASQGASTGAGASATGGSSGAGGQAAALPGSSGSLELPDIGTVDSKKELVDRIRALGVSNGTPSSANSQNLAPAEGSASQEFSPLYGSVTNCVVMTQNATGDHFGPGAVATATYDGRRSIVMELWKTGSQPQPGADQVAVATENGCKLLLTATF